MKTITIQIGNTDNKLSQKQWAAFVHAIENALHKEVIHFFGAPPNYTMWQNAAWVFESNEEDLGHLERSISEIGQIFKQDSIAWTEGQTKFI